MALRFVAYLRLMTFYHNWTCAHFQIKLQIQLFY